MFFLASSSMPISPKQFSQVLTAAAAGNQSACDQLFPLLYEELHQLASGLMRLERHSHTLQPTALINEAYLRLANTSVSDNSITFENLSHFMATAARVMRRILINHAKSKQRLKRTPPGRQTMLEDVALEFENEAIDLIELDTALQQLEKLDTTQYQLVEMRFFGGMTMDQCAQVLNMSTRKLYLEWAHARAWLKTRLESEDAQS